MQNTIDRFKAEVRKELGIQSNADRIRSMTNEELAEFITDINRHCLAGITKIDCSRSKDCSACKDVVLDWLQKKVGDCYVLW